MRHRTQLRFDTWLRLRIDHGLWFCGDMASTWIVIAHRAGARIIEYAGRSEGLSLVEEIDHAEGRLKNSELETDKPGAASEGGGKPGGHGMGNVESAHDHVAGEFARRLAQTLAAARNEHRVDALYLVAEPRFLGMLRGALDGPTAGLVRDTLPKDLARVPLHTLPKHLGAIVRL